MLHRPLKLFRYLSSSGKDLMGLRHINELDGRVIRCSVSLRSDHPYHDLNVLLF